MRMTMKKLILATLLSSTALLATGLVYAGPLYFPHVATIDSWQTEIAVINTSDQAVTGTLRGLSNAGQPIDAMSITLPARGRRQITVATELTNHTSIGYIIFDTSSNTVQGYTKFYQEGIYRVAIPAVREVNTSDLYISHIASSSEWWTGISLVNTTSAAKTLTINFSDGQTKQVTLAANEHRAFAIRDLFNNQPQPTIQSGVITNASGIIGLELFGSFFGGRQLEGILLTDKTALTLYYPHLESNGWWTGIVAYNPSNLASTITITTYNSQGSPLSTKTDTIPGKAKYVGNNMELGFPAQTAWFRIDSTKPLSGFELISTNDFEQLAAYAGNGGGGTKAGVLPKIEKSGWTAITLVNTGDSTASVTLTAYTDAGAVVDTQVISIAGHAKYVGEVSASNATYITYSADKNIVGAQVNGTADWTMLDGLPGLAALPSSTGSIATYIPGVEMPLAQAVIGPAGGTLKGPAGSLLDGVTVSFPPGAVSAPTTFTLGYNNGGTFTNLAAEVLVNLVLVLNSGGQHEFTAPLTITYPYTDPVKIPVAFHLREDGSFNLMRPLPVDRVAGRAGFLTWHASNFLLANVLPASPAPVTTDFAPPADGFALDNDPPFDEYAPVGRCVGMSSFAKWYFETYGSGLFGRFSAVIPKDAAGKSLSGEEVLATRAHTSVIVNGGFVPPLSNRQALVEIMAGIRISGQTQVIGISFNDGSGLHALLAIGYSDNQIAVYDSNYPGEWKAIDYRLQPDMGDAWVGYGEKHSVNIFGDMPRAESFPAMLRDAEAGFHDQSQTKIEITSHQKGATVSEAQITLRGKIHSGQVLIAEATVWVEYKAGGESERQTITVSEENKDFSVVLKMLDGENRVRFTTRGRTVNADGQLMEIRNDLEKDEDKFVLNYNQTGKQGNLTFVVTTQHGTFNLEGNARIYYNGVDDPDDGDGDHPEFTGYTVAGTVTMKTTSFLRSDKKRCVLQGAAEHALDAPPLGSYFRAWKTDPPTAWFWFSAPIWEYQCEGDGMESIYLGFVSHTGTGAGCDTIAFVPIDDLTSPAGSFTMNCDSHSPYTITGTWAFQP